MEQQLLIPEKINVGFCCRNDTYTAKLGYVIYYDHKGVLRKEKSWQGWRDQKIDPQEFKNVPTEGFVLNRKVGGYKSDWNYRSAKIRIYDPRDWEFEISLENLLFILSVGDCSRGKGLEGNFVYAWQGNELVLLPVASENYKNSIKYTELQSCKVNAKELIVGASYKTKNQIVYVYLGKFMKNLVKCNNARYSWGKEKTGPRQLFWDGKNFVFLKNLSSIAVLHSDSVSSDFAELVDKYNKSIWGSKPVKLFTKKIFKKDPENCYLRQSWTKEESPGTYFQYHSNYANRYDGNKNVFDKIISITANVKIFIHDDQIVSESVGKIAYKDPEETKRQKEYFVRHGSNVGNFLDEYIEPTNLELWVELESGSKFQVDRTSLIDLIKEEETHDDDENEE